MHSKKTMFVFLLYKWYNIFTKNIIVQVSLDGNTAQSYAHQRGNKESFKQTIKN